MQTRYIYDLHNNRLPPGVGNKAQKLHFLSKKGFQTPSTCVCTWDAYLRYRDDDSELVDLLRAELEGTLDLDRVYAVRSSANIEDGLEFSFAGQFKSVLNVRGLDAIIQAIWSIWATTEAPGVKAYLDKNGMDWYDLHMAILIQEMIPPMISGVSFSKNPMTGLDEVVVEAVAGSGEALVQDGVTPARWINKWGTWIVQPESDGIELALIEQVVEQTKEIATTYGQPVDLEWVYDGHSISWVQMREITSPDVTFYSNRISKEQLPGIIKPLIWSVNVPLVNGAWLRLITEVIGPNDIDANSLAKSFYYRAYFNMGAMGQIFESMGLPRETLEILAGIEVEGPDRPSFRPSPKTYRLIPRMLRFAADKLRFDRKVKTFVPAMKKQYQALPLDRVDQLEDRQLLEEINRLFALNQKTAYYNIVTPLLAQMYNMLLKTQLSRIGIDFESFDVTRGLEELQEFDPNASLSELNHLFKALDTELQALVRESSYEKFERLSGDGIAALQSELRHFIDQFGHLSDSGNDFSSVPWRENPDLILQMAIDYVSPDGGSATKLSFTDLETTGPRRWMLGSVYRRARRFTLHREAIGSLFTFGYGLFRIFFMELAERLAQRGILESQEDILYLHFEEVRELVDRDINGKECRRRIACRKEEIEKCRGITPPTIIYGDHPIPLDTRTTRNLKGTPTSRGHHTGPVRVVRGIRDFDKLKEGDVLVIPYSDVGWTPLFTKAGAVVAESGGMLSHSSIVAREYDIPAVVSVLGACSLQDETVVTVDGYRGEVIVHELAEEGRKPTPERVAA